MTVNTYHTLKAALLKQKESVKGSSVEAKKFLAGVGLTEIVAGAASKSANGSTKLPVQGFPKRDTTI